MASHRDSRAFLALGTWLPLDVEEQLFHQLGELQAWATAHEPLVPFVARAIHMQLADIEHLLDLGLHCNLLESADRWRAAVRDIHLLTEWLTAWR